MEPPPLPLALPLLLLFLPLLLVSSDHPSAPSPSPSSSPSPPPSRLAQLNPVFSTSTQPPPRPPYRPRSSDGLRERPPPSAVAARAWDLERLNFGEKIGLLFLAVAVALQVVLGGFLAFKRLQLRKVDRRNRPMAEELSSDSSSSRSFG